MNQRTAKTLKRLVTLTAHTSPESPRRRYQDHKRDWNKTPRNQRGLVREGMETTIANLQRGIVPATAESS
jgi:hypothetical protein